MVFLGYDRSFRLRLTCKVWLVTTVRCRQCSKLQRSSCLFALIQLFGRYLLYASDVGLILSSMGLAVSQAVVDVYSSYKMLESAIYRKL
jgi:hypothetical protein